MNTFMISIKNLNNIKKFKSVCNFSTSSKFEDVAIISAVRTPIGSIGSTLTSFSGPQLGSIAIKGAIEKAGPKFQANMIDEVIMGNVLSANSGQAPARQASMGAGLGTNVVCTTVNKVCASGMKSIMMAAQTIQLGQADVIVAGGFESMSNVPFYVDKGRYGFKYGHQQLFDGIVKDGLTDVYNKFHMGNCAENTAKKFNITREQQDQHAIESYKRATEATKSGFFKKEIVPVKITNKKGEETSITEDEEYKNIKADKISTLKPAFDPKGTVTAANASKLNDGASALILMSISKAKQLGITPLAIIKGYADAEQDPIDFPTAPSKAIPKALKRANLTTKDIDFYEINQAFSVVSLANQKELSIDPSKVDIWGGGVALGHPIGASGARIVTTLINVLESKNGKYGVASICNGGGGASAIVIERVQQ